MKNSEYSKIVEEVFSNTKYIFYQHQKAAEELLNFYLKIKNEKTSVSYNIMIVGDDKEQGSEFYFKLLEAAKKSNCFRKGFIVYNLKEMIEKKVSLYSLKKNYSIVVIDEVEEGLMKEAYWLELEKQFDDPNLHDLIKIICINNLTAETLKRDNEQLFYRTFPYSSHVVFREVDVEDIFGHLIQKLNLNDYECTEEFCEEIKKYIATVYPKANLRNGNFVDDLYGRIVRAMLVRADVERKLDKECVPKYKRAEKIEEIKAEEIEELPLSVENNGNVYYQKNELKNPDILLLALSTFPYGKEIKPSRFKYRDKEYEGQYQLDPVPKLLADQLGKPLDMIIMLCTDGVYLQETITLPDGKKLKTSPIDFFKRQIRDCVNAELEDDQKFVIVPINPDSPAEGIQKVVEIIRMQNGSKLYIDPHGGFRSVQLILEAILSLLRTEPQITIEKIFDVRHAANREILDNDESLRIFEFVSGINEFINYGRFESMRRFFDDKELSEKKLIDCIQEIAEGIQLCIIPKFEDGLDKLVKYFNCNPNFQSIYLNIFKDTILRGYDKMLIKENGNWGRSKDIIAEISWCIDKGFYQQALVLIESKIPILLYNTDTHGQKNKIFNYDKDIEILLEDAKNKRHDKSELSEYIFNQYMPIIIPKDHLNKKLDKFINEVLDVFNGKKSRTDFMNKMKKNGEKYSLDINPNPKWGIPKIRLICTKNCVGFIELHLILKHIRNHASHALENSNFKKIEVSKIESMMKIYIDLLGKMQKSEDYIKLVHIN